MWVVLPFLVQVIGGVHLCMGCVFVLCVNGVATLPEISGGRRPATAAPLAGDRRSGGGASTLMGRRPLGVCREKHCIFVSFYSVGAGTSFEHQRTRLDETDSTQVESRPNSHGAKTYAVLKFLMGRLSCRGFCHWASVARAKRWGGDRRPSLRGGDRRRLW